MKEEIKEILDELRDKDCYINDETTLTFDEAKDILDYITNLQEENERLKGSIEVMKHNYHLLVRCIENGESMTQKFENGLTYKDYKQRNEKAINILELSSQNKGICTRPETDTIQSALNILKDDKDE